MAITYHIASRHLHITVDGTWTKQTIIDTQNHAAELIKQHQLTGLLIDLRQANIQIALHEIMEINVRLRPLFPQHVKHAIVYSETTLTKMQAQFNENVSVNRGILSKVFTDPAEALDWLQGT